MYVGMKSKTACDFSKFLCMFFLQLASEARPAYQVPSEMAISVMLHPSGSTGSAAPGLNK